MNGYVVLPRWFVLGQEEDLKSAKERMITII